MIAKVNGKLLSLLLKMILNLSNLTEEMEKRLSDQLRYLTISAIDEEWGIVVTTVGYQFIPPKGNYPLSKHPDNYNFKPQTGRILNEYQLVYITKGSGYFSSQSCKMQKINAGTMILLFPGEWHSYYPDSETGWDEYWVGFRGVHIDRRVEKRFFTREEPLQHIGLSATIVGLYEDILKFASQEKTGYQEMISSIVLHILGTVYYKRRNNSFTKLRRCHALFLLEEGGELSGILEFETVGYFRDIHAAAGKQFLCLSGKDGLPGDDFEYRPSYIGYGLL